MEKVDYDSELRLYNESRMRETLVEHLGADGVWFDSSAWIVTARRRAEGE